MTAAVALDLRARSIARRIAVERELVPVALLLVFVGALVAATWGTWGDPSRDTGYDLVAGARVAHGSIPYVDFVYYYGPLSPFLLGLADWIGGDGLLPAVCVGIVITAAIVVATYLLARRQAGRTAGLLAGAIAAAVAVVPSNFNFVLPHTDAETLGVLCILLALLALQRATWSPRPWDIVAAGLAGGLVALTKVELVAAFGVAAVAWLWTRPATRRRDALLLLGPAVAVPAVVYGAFLAVVSPHRLFFENLYPVATLHAAGNAVLRLHAPLTAASFVQLAGKTLLYGVGTGAMLALAFALRRKGWPRASAIAVLAGAGAALLAVGVARPETLRYWLGYAYAWIPLGAVVLLVLALRRKDAPTAAFAGALAALAGTTYATFLLNADRPQPAVYAAPLAAVFLARVHVVEVARARALGVAWLAVLAIAGAGLALHDAHAKSAPIGGPGGTVDVQPAVAGTYADALRWISETTRPGDPILLAPQLTELYTLSGRTDPLPEISLLPGALPTQSAERAAIARLRERHVALVVTDRRNFTEYGHTSFGGSFDRVLAGWIQHTFNHVATLHGVDGSPTLDVWTRRTK